MQMSRCRTTRLGQTRRAAGARRALILPVVLVVLLLLALLSAAFSFHVQADFTASHSMSQHLQTRLAAEAGVQRVMLMLRAQRDNSAFWYHNPALFDQALVWTPEIKPEQVGRPDLLEDTDNPYAFRFSIVADNPSDDETLIRFGVTDEAAKLNLNHATPAQLGALLRQVVPPDTQVQELIDPLLDWIDEDDEPREFGAETEYYASLEVPYRAKNAPLETVEELLLIKGFNGQILYAEDFDRNGLLTLNEDDGDVSFPPDNGDGVLNRGLLPYVTVHSQEFNAANDNKPRIFLFGTDKEALREDLMEAFDNDEQAVNFLIKGAKNEGTEQIHSIAELLSQRIIDDRMTDSPFKGDLATRLFDKCTLDPNPQFFGRINVNTAPPQVLRCVPDLPAERIPLILQKRAQISEIARTSTAWLVTEKILDAQEYRAVEKYITGRGRQFTVESIGFADHTGVFTRLQVILDMRGPMSQIVYYRDLTRLGLAYPIHGKEGERSLVRENG